MTFKPRNPTKYACTACAGRKELFKGFDNRVSIRTLWPKIVAPKFRQMVEKSALIFIKLGEHVIFRQRSHFKIMPTLFAVSTFYKGNTEKWIKLFVPVPVTHRKTYTRKKFHKIRERALSLVSVNFTWAYVVTIFVTQTMVHAHPTVCKSHYEPTVNAQRRVCSTLSKCSKLIRN